MRETSSVECINATIFCLLLALFGKDFQAYFPASGGLSQFKRKSIRQGRSLSISHPAGCFSYLQFDDLLVQQNIFFSYDPIRVVVTEKLIPKLASLGHFLQKIGQGIGFVKATAQLILH